MTNRAVGLMVVGLLTAFAIYSRAILISLENFSSGVIREVFLALGDSDFHFFAFLALAALLLTECCIHLLQGRFLFPTSLRNLFLALFLAILFSELALSYSWTPDSVHLLTLVFGILLGRAAAMLLLRVGRCVEPRLHQNLARQLQAFILLIIACLLVGMLLNMAGQREYLYRGRLRWCGAWGNPNSAGAFAGLGFMLVVASLCGMRSTPHESSDFQIPFYTYGIGRRSLHWAVCIPLYLCGIAMGARLLQSYSRGAWVAVTLSLSYLVFRINSECSSAASVTSLERPLAASNNQTRKLIHMSIVVVVVIASAFMYSRSSEIDIPILQRLISVTKSTDFSWRNRLAANIGQLQIIVDHPLYGVGWGRSLQMYDQYYRPASILEPDAVWMNDYLSVAAAFGVPAVLCLLLYIAIPFMQFPPSATMSTGIEFPCNGRINYSRLICRTAAMTLAVSFWFDGGLFNLATAAPFWTLLELGTSQET